MKRKMAAILACALVSVTVLGGCGSEEVEEVETESVETQEDEISAEEILAATDYDVSAYVTLPDDYMDLTIELSSSYEVTEAEIRENIESILPYYPAYTLTDKTTVEDGDTVDIDFVGLLDGEEFEGGSSDNYKLLIGSGSFIDGFEDGLIGQEVGTTVNLDLTFPEDYTEDLAGQDVVFVVTINGIMEETILSYDEITDEYVEETFGGYGLTTVDDLKADAEASIESSNESDREYEIQSLTLDALVEQSTVEFPEGVLEGNYDTFIEEVREAAEESGVSYEEYVTGTGEFENVEDYEAYVLEYLEIYLRQEMVLEAIVADQQISVSRSDFDAYVNEYVAYYGSYYGFESTEDFYDYFGGEEYALLNYAENMALILVENNANVIVPESEEPEVTEEAEETEEEVTEETEEGDTEETEEAQETEEEEP